MAGLFDPSMFPNAMGSGAPQMGLLARLAGMINQPTSQAPGFQGTPNYMDTAQWPVGPMGAPSGNAMAQGLIPPQGGATTQQAPPMPQMPQGAPQGGGFMDALSGFLGNHSNALMGLGTGIATGGGMGAAAGLAHGSDTDYQRNLLQTSQAQTLQAYLAAGVPHAQAMAMTLNPELAKIMAPQFMAKPTFGQIGESPLGKQFGFIDTNKGTVTAPGDAGGGIGGTSGLNILAPGVKQMDPSLQGDAYMQQFGPEVQAAAKAYINGDVMPTGNPRQQGIGNFAKTVAQKWGQDTGNPVSDITYAQKRKMQVDLASSGNSSMGGILANGKSAFAHLADTSDKLADLGNFSSDIPIVGGAAATFGNWVGNKVTPTSDTKGKIAAANDALGHYGQESTKFYAGSGGGVEERMAAMKNANPTSASGAEQAAYLETEKGLMLDRLQQKENQIRETMGDGYLQAHPVMTPELQSTIARINANIAKLRGQAPAAVGATAPTQVIPPGNYNWTPEKGLH